MSTEREFAECPECHSENVQMLGADSCFCLDCAWDDISAVTKENDPLTSALQHWDAKARREAAQTLINIGDAERHLATADDFEPLLEALGDPDDDVRYFATVALGKLGDTRALEALQQVTRSDSSELVRQGAMTAIEQLETCWQ